MAAIRNGEILEQIKLEDGYKIVAREMRSELCSHITIKIFKGKSIVFPNEIPEFVKKEADILYKKYHVSRW